MRTVCHWRRGFPEALRILAGVYLALWLPTTARAQSEAVEYYALDAVGSVRVVFDVNGNILGRMDYDPAGQQLLPSTAKQTNIYARLFVEDETALADASARSLQVRTGRFTSIDPIYNGLFDPQRWNRYAYALNNPITFGDADGLNADYYCDPNTCSEVAASKPSSVDTELPGAMRLWLLFGSGMGGGGGSVSGAGTSDGGGDGGGGDINVEVAAQAVLDLYALPSQLAIDGIKDFDAKNTQCNSGTGMGRVGACATVLAAVAPLGLPPSVKGKLGETFLKAAEGLGDKRSVVINGVKRIPDGLKDLDVFESKNVGYQALTSQLGDYVALAQQQGGRLIVYLRQTTVTSAPFKVAQAAGQIIVKHFPW